MTEFCLFIDKILSFDNQKRKMSNITCIQIYKSTIRFRNNLINIKAMQCTVVIKMSIIFFS